MGCGPSDGRDGVVSGTPHADSLRVVRLAMGPMLAENSAAAASVRHPGVLYSLNDSGNDSWLYAFDSTGADRGRLRLLGALNRDWEAAAVGPCANGGGRSCVYVGDVGDNGLERPWVRIYRGVEPESLAEGASVDVSADSITFRYPDRPHNVESMVVAPDGGLLLITKERMLGAANVPRPTLVYRVDPSAWGREAGHVEQAALFDSLPIVPLSSPRRAVTDAALSPDGRYLIVRTYAEVFLFATDSLTGRVRPGAPHTECRVTDIGEAQGEGVGFLGVANGARLALTSEGSNEPLRLVTCPLPPR